MAILKNIMMIIKHIVCSSNLCYFRICILNSPLQTLNRKKCVSQTVKHLFGFQVQTI